MYQEGMFVCVDCFEDPGLIGFIKRYAVAEECSFCPAIDKVPIAAPVEEVSDHIIECLRQEYDDAANQLGWIGAEGGYQGNHWDTPDLLFYEVGLSFPQENEKSLSQALFGDLIDQVWCERNAYGLNDEEWSRFSWEHFCEAVMHQRRFFFSGMDRDPDDPEVYSPAQVLQTIFQYAQQMDLFKQMPSGTQLFRARWEGGKPHLETPKELGPPPLEQATQSNRMSPAGIPMFYGCDDEDTALKETATGASYFAIGRFETRRSINLLDLTAIPPIPSLFDSIPDSVEVPPRRVLKFLHHVAREVSRPIERGDRVHVEYVPTQVVTEFIRDQLTWENSRADGIKYFSSVHPDHVSYVLFANQGNVVSPPANSSPQDQWLRLTETKHMWVNE